MSVRTATGKARVTPPRGQSVWPHEIEPGRSVVNNWDKHLSETWAERKARRAQEAEACWQAFLADYLRPSAPTMAACYRRLEQLAAESRWITPSLASLRARLKRELLDRGDA